MRREYRLVWKRAGNSSPRTKRFSNMKRLRGYLRALTATTAEERYGDLVDKPMHPSCVVGGYSMGDPPCSKCNGRTWREKYEQDQKDWASVMAPLVEVRIESRELPAWTTEVTMTSDGEFEFGDIVRLSVDYVRQVPTTFKDLRVMFIAGRNGLIIGKDAGHLLGTIHNEVTPLRWQKADD